MQQTSYSFRKDESLDQLANFVNVAQFVSFSPDSGAGVRQAYARVLGYEPNYKFKDLGDAVVSLLARSSEASLNVRSFKPNDLRSHEFVYGLKSAQKVIAVAERILTAGFHVIINETIDIHDGGVSGVMQGGTVEFAPDDTPRCVEKPGVASLPRPWATRIIETVYGVSFDREIGDDYRLEFSVHPKPRGWRNTHILGWELEQVGALQIPPSNVWPNNFSRLIGDKAYGLMIANEAQLPVPKTTVIGRRIAPFIFGKDTGSAEFWIRTCPREQVPGKYTTHHGWIDPFLLMAKEDPSGEYLSSVLAQQAVPSKYSGALIIDASGAPIIEGKEGEGEDLMRGIAPRTNLPARIIDDVIAVFECAISRLGPIRFEWVHDGMQAWIVQLHRGATQSLSKVLVPGEPQVWRRFAIADGLESLRSTLNSLDSTEGILLIGDVGLTSHVADVVRKAARPARIE
jgi:hypothetical protein